MTSFHIIMMTCLYRQLFDQISNILQLMHFNHQLSLLLFSASCLSLSNIFFYDLYSQYINTNSIYLSYLHFASIIFLSRSFLCDHILIWTLIKAHFYHPNSKELIKKWNINSMLSLCGGTPEQTILLYSVSTWREKANA